MSLLVLRSGYTVKYGPWDQAIFYRISLLCRNTDTIHNKQVGQYGTISTKQGGQFRLPLKLNIFDFFYIFKAIYDLKFHLYLK